MKKWIKWLAIGLSVVLVLVLAAALIIPRLLDSEAIKQQITEQASQALGLPIAINGELTFGILPSLSAQVQKIVIAEPDGNSEISGTIDQARVAVALAPLLQGQLVVKGLRVDGGQLLIRDPTTSEVTRISDLQIDTGALNLANLSSRPVPVTLSGVLATTGDETGQEFKLSTNALMDLNAESFQLNNLELMLASPEQGPDLLLQAALLQLELTPQTLDLPVFEASLGNVRLTGSLSATDVLGDPAISADVSSEAFSPRDLLKQLGQDAPQTSDPDALTTARFDASLRGTATRLVVKPMLLTLDESTVQGEVVVRQFQKTSIGFDLQVDEMNLDRYLPPATEGGTSDTPAPPPAALPLGALTQINAEGELRFTQLTLMGMNLQQATLGVKSGNGKARLHPFGARLYGGRYSGDVSVDATGPVPVISFDERLDAVDVGQLASQLTGLDQLSGTIGAHIQGTGSGLTANDLISSLGGVVDLQLSDGALEGIDVWHEVRSALALIRQEENTSTNSGQTVFSNLNLNAGMKDGLLTTDSLNARLPFLDLGGKGVVDLAQMDLDLGLTATVRKTPQVSNDPLTSELAGRSIPLRIRGPLSAPKIEVDGGQLLQGAITERLLERLSEDDEDTGADEDSDANKDAARDLLRGLLGGSRDKDEPVPKDEG